MYVGLANGYDITMSKYGGDKIFTINSITVPITFSIAQL